VDKKRAVISGLRGAVKIQSKKMGTGDITFYPSEFNKPNNDQ
jgi:hypothetical protein